MRLLILCFFFSIKTFPQQKIDFGEINEDKNFPCAGFTSYIDSIQKTKNICNSKNILEIRLDVFYNPLPSYESFILAFTGNQWTATNYKGSLADGNFEISQSKTQINFDSVFSVLKLNRVFTLPDQQKLKYNAAVDDGISYTLVFKAGAKLGGYSFNNPDIYEKKYSSIKEFRRYNQIVSIFRSLFN